MPTKANLHPFGHGGDLVTAAEAYGLAAEQIIDFSANINPLGPPPGLKEYLMEHFAVIASYPDPACRSLIAAIKERYQPNHEVVTGNGAGELIYDLMRCLPAGPVLIPAPGFTLYATAAEAAGRPVIYHYLKREHDFILQVDSFGKEIKEKRPALVMICNPNNPTGAGLTRPEILAISKVCAQSGAYLVVDEAFLEFNPYWQQRTMVSSAPENVLVLCSLTKMYAIAGLRLGFLTVPAHLHKKLLDAKHPWSVNAFAQLAGQFILRDRKYVEQTVDYVNRQAGELYDALKNIPGINPFPPTANYIFLETRNLPSPDLQAALIKEKILIRDCGNYQGLNQHYARVAVRNSADNKKLIAALSAVANKI
ncbi:MAG: threonine-phosphate decarboxylase [Firmicutes bacterium]|nr:threonine-phosphate decarboxylase [Bacillota bacterium]